VHGGSWALLSSAAAGGACHGGWALWLCMAGAAAAVVVAPREGVLLRSEGRRVGLQLHSPPDRHEAAVDGGAWQHDSVKVVVPINLQRWELLGRATVQIAAGRCLVSVINNSCLSQ
jgi:hypothetical protein